MPDSINADMRKRLLKLREELESMVETSEESSQVVELDQTRVGRLSRMDAMQAQQMAQASARRRKLMLRQISAALARIEKDDYGYCRSCDEPIAHKRLEFDPTALLCIKCANEAEQ